MSTEKQADELRAKAKHLLNSLFKTPDGYSNEAVDQFVDCLVAVAIMEALYVLEQGIKELQGDAP